MASAEQRQRRRAQRDLAKRVRSGYQKEFQRESRRSLERNKEYIEHLLQHPEDITEADKKMLARRASYAKWERERSGSHPGADQRWREWEQYFYHSGDAVF